MVVTVGVGSEAFKGSDAYWRVCDSLEKELMARLHASVSGLVERTEPSGRSGETLSVRFAVWGASLEAVVGAIDTKWDLLEVAPFSEVYRDQDSAELYARAVVARQRAGVACT